MRFGTGLDSGGFLKASVCLSLTPSLLLVLTLLLVGDRFGTIFVHAACFGSGPLPLLLLLLLLLLILCLLRERAAL